MALQGRNDIGDRQLAAVMETNVAADLEGPLRRIRRRLPGFGKGRQRRAGLRVGFDQRIAPEVTDDEGDGTAIGGGVERIGGGAALEAELQMAAALWLLRARVACRQRCAEAGRKSERCGTRQEAAPADAGRSHARGDEKAVGSLREFGHFKVPFGMMFIEET
ncbi:hypothetical protein D9M70_466820 [compost metagenome]